VLGVVLGAAAPAAGFIVVAVDGAPAVPPDLAASFAACAAVGAPGVAAVREESANGGSKSGLMQADAPTQSSAAHAHANRR
jgi:hypothetical protein